MQQIKMEDGLLAFDGSVVTLEFSGMLTQTVKKAASPRRIPVHDIVGVDLEDGGMARPGYIRFRRASVDPSDRFKAATDLDTMTFLSSKKPDGLDGLVERIRGQIAVAPAVPPPPGASGAPAAPAAGSQLPSPEAVLPPPPPGAPTSPPPPSSPPLPAAAEPSGAAPSPPATPAPEPASATTRSGGLFRSKRRQEAEAEIARLSGIIERAGGEQAPQLAREVDRLRQELAGLAQQLSETGAELARARSEVVVTREEALLQEVGIYDFRHPLEDAVAYKSQLAALKDQIKTLARNGGAVVGATAWQVDGSAAKGRKMVKDFSKLMLRAYNNEADNLVRAMKPFKLDSSVSRLHKTRETIARLGKTMSIEVTDGYHRLRIAELELTADYLAKVAEEKERAREERERLREERKAMAELKREEQRLEKEANHRRSVLAQLESSGASPEEVEAARAALAEVESALQGVLDREANVRAGYVYVISNVGSFGEGIVKVGMTRRLEPMDRVHELGGASVPFRFDVHALVFSEDAVGLEADLHRALAPKRVNLVNMRREYFYATPDEVRALLEQRHGQLLRFDELPEAIEWHQSSTIRRREYGEVELPSGA